MVNLSVTDLDKLRLRYRPDKISVLFVGESPPAGGTFFYKSSPTCIAIL